MQENRDEIKAKPPISTRARAIQMAKQGATTRQIAETLGIKMPLASRYCYSARNPGCDAAAVRRYYQRNAAKIRQWQRENLYEPAKPKPWTAAERQRLKRLIASGKTYSQAGNELGRNRNQVASQISRMRANGEVA